MTAKARDAGFAFRAVVADSAYGDQDGLRDGHAETWQAADAQLGGWGPDGVRRLVVATADPAALPDKATWYLVTNPPRPGRDDTAVASCGRRPDRGTLGYSLTLTRWMDAQCHARATLPCGGSG